MELNDASALKHQLKINKKGKTNLQASGQNAEICPTAHSEDGCLSTETLIY